MRKQSFGFAPIIIIVALSIGAIAVSFLVLQSAPKTDQSETVIEKIDDVVSAPSPEPTPFESLTIPYLRNREYDSRLATLREYSTNASYGSFLTSYDSEGFRVNGLLTVPTGEVPDGGFPAIVFVHGYIAPTIYKTTERYTSHVDYLARNGFVVFKIDLRGHGESEGLAMGAYYSGDYVIDVLNARAALSASDFVNKDKIGLWGHSMAGNVVLRSMVSDQNIPASVIWAGAVYTYQDMQEFGIDDNSYRPPTGDSERQRKRDELRNAHGSFEAGDKFWKQVVPTNYLEGVSGALQIHHAIDDGVVDIGYSRNLDEVLNGTGINHELVEYSSGGHNITGSSFARAMQSTVEFFNTNLK